MDLADALVRLNDAVVFHKCEDLDIPQARDMMVFVADTLGLQRPSTPPRICLDDEMADNVLGNFVVSIGIITLKQWTGSLRDQSILIHELAHCLQQYNSQPFCEKQAEFARHAWLEAHQCQSSVPKPKHPLQLFS